MKFSFRNKVLHFLLAIITLLSSTSFAQSSSLLIRTGWDYNTNTYFPCGSFDPNWIVVQDDQPSTPEPRFATSSCYPFSGNQGSANGKITPSPSLHNTNNKLCINYMTSCLPYPNYSNSSSDCSNNLNLGGNSLPPGPDSPRITQFTFCISSGTDLSKIQLYFNDFRGDDYCKICLNGNFIDARGTNAAYYPVTVTNVFQIGVNTLAFYLYNTGKMVSEFNFDGQLTTSQIGATPFSRNGSVCPTSKSIVGQKFFDVNANGIKEPNETNVPNWPIILKDGGGIVIATAQTNLQGNYSFTGLTGSNYSVWEGNNGAQFSQTYPSNGNHVINFTSTQTYASSIDFGNFITCCTGGINVSAQSPYETFDLINNSINVTQISCTGVYLSFSADCIGSSNFSWNFGDGYSVSGAPQTMSHTYTMPGLYVLTITATGIGCSMTRTIQINITSNCVYCCNQLFVNSNSLKNIHSIANAPMSIGADACPYTPLIFNANCPNSSSYQWFWGDGSSSVINNGSNIAHTYLNPGAYLIKIIALGSESCFQSTEFINLNVSYDFCPPCCVDPFVTTNAQNLSLTNTAMLLTAENCLQIPTTFTAFCPGADGYIWNFGDGYSASGPTASHLYGYAGTYVVTVTSPNGCAPEETINLTISNSYCQPCCQLDAVIKSSSLFNLHQTYPGIYSAEACQNSPIIFSTINCDPLPTLNWYLPGAPISYQIGAAANANYSTPLTYPVTLTMSGLEGCFQQETINLTIVDCSCSGAQIIGPSGGGCTDYPVFLKVGGCIDPSATYNWNFGDGTTASGSQVNHTYSGNGTYNVSMTIIHPPNAPLTITSNVVITDCPLLNNCKDCVGSFSPEPGEYIISLWVKQDYAWPLTNFPWANVSISFIGSTATFGPFFPNSAKNKVIDGWQRIEEKFTVPVGATSIKIQLANAATGVWDSYFDDIRIYPVNGSMKSYVYDPITLRLSAELDENNYATFYEYDEEGKLIRVKKETERGIMTIKESRSSSKK